ncbi:response regulator [Achromobacter sp. NPDC058515]|uniref:response regulator n=1 Tax=Achromobacter sp. NPDC058515 TaxID=3346533 RepID=UPI00365D166F
MNDHVLEGLRVLVVEDEALIALFLEEGLLAAGCEVVGPVSKLDAAVKLAEDEQLDAAILDVTVRGGSVFPVAKILMERGIPFTFATGYGEWALPDAFRGKPVLKKPFTFAELERALQTAMAPPPR